MSYSFTPTQRRAIEQMKAQGFTHGKIELEAQLDRDPDGGYGSCDNCDEGSVDCYDCDGTGVVETSDESSNGTTRAITAMCSNCDGDGYVTCGQCDGDWESSSAGGDFGSDDYCQEWLHEHVSFEAYQALVYSQFYNDGSVDSEFTFTMKLDDLPYAVEFIDAFNSLAEEIGNGMETSGAGMHLTVLTSGQYPSRTELDYDKLENFTEQVTKLLPALYFVASPDHKSRGLQFRPALIASDKYAAISTHRGTCLEYRIFETCYEKPEILLQNFEVIAHTLKYYSTTRTLNLPTPSYNLARSGNGVGRFYNTPAKLTALNQGLKYLKPKDKTIATLKSERNFKTTLKGLRVEEKIMTAKLTKAYEDYAQQWNRNNERAITDALDMAAHHRERYANMERRDIANYIYDGQIDRMHITDRGEMTAMLQRQGSLNPCPPLEVYVANEMNN